MRKLIFLALAGYLWKKVQANRQPRILTPETNPGSRDFS